MPLELCIAPETLQRAWDILLSGLKSSTFSVFVDRDIVYCDTFDLHLRTDEDALVIIQHAGLAQEMEKACPFRTLVDYLGHVIVLRLVQCRKEKHRDYT